MSNRYQKEDAPEILIVFLFFTLSALIIGLVVYGVMK